MSLPLFQTPKPIDSHFKSDSDIVLFNGEIQSLLAEIPDNSIQLIVTSPPYNLGKDYENRIEIEHYLEKQADIIAELYREKIASHLAIKHLFSGMRRENKSRLAEGEVEKHSTPSFGLFGTGRPILKTRLLFTRIGLWR